MHPVDLVNAGLDAAPRRWVRRILIALVVYMAVSGSVNPILWWVRAEAESLMDSLQPAIEHLVTIEPQPARGDDAE